MLETLVIDPTKPYHHLFSPNTVRAARERMAEYAASHPEPWRPRIGADDIGLFESPRLDLLEEITGITPSPLGWSCLAR